MYRNAIDTVVVLSRVGNPASLFQLILVTIFFASLTTSLPAAAGDCALYEHNCLPLLPTIVWYLRVGLPMMMSRANDGRRGAADDGR